MGRGRGPGTVRGLTTGLALVGLAGCATNTPPPTAWEPAVVVADVETVFYGLEDPVYVVWERISELYRGVPVDSSDQGRRRGSTVSSAGLAEGRLHVGIGAHDDGAEEPRDVRCFTYRLDEDRQEAVLEDIAVGACAALAGG